MVVFHYSALDDRFEGPDLPPVREALRALFWDRYHRAEQKLRMTAEAAARQERGSPCSEPQSVCTGQPEPSRTGPTDFLKLTRFDGASSFIDAKGIFRFRVVVNQREVEELDLTSPAEVAHLESLVRG